MIVFGLLLKCRLEFPSNVAPENFREEIWSIFGLLSLVIRVISVCFPSGYWWFRGIAFC